MITRSYSHFFVLTLVLLVLLSACVPVQAPPATDTESAVDTTAESEVVTASESMTETMDVAAADEDDEAMAEESEDGPPERGAVAVANNNDSLHCGTEIVFQRQTGPSSFEWNRGLYVTKEAGGYTVAYYGGGSVREAYDLQEVLTPDEATGYDIANGADPLPTLDHINQMYGKGCAEFEEEYTNNSDPQYMAAQLCGVTHVSMGCSADCNAAPTSSTITDQADIDAILKAHNDFRKDNAPLTWDPTLAAYAQGWAEALAKKNQLTNDPMPGYQNWPHSSESCYAQTYDNHYGENIVTGGGAPGEHIRLFGEEEMYWVSNGTSGSCQGGECGHFLQVAHYKVTKVGCGHLAPDSPWVCAYDAFGARFGSDGYEDPYATK